MKTKAIVSLADEKYFDLLIELIDSIKKKPESKDIAICVLDAGLNDNQREQLKKKVQEIFFDKPSKMFAKDLAHLLNIHSLTNITEGTVRIPEKNRINSAGVNEMYINTSLPKGSFSTPGYKDINYHAHEMLFQRPITKSYFKLNSIIEAYNKNTEIYTWLINREIQDISLPNFYPSF